MSMLRAKQQRERNSNWKEADCNGAQFRATAAKWDLGVSQMLAEDTGDESDAWRRFSP